MTPIKPERKSRQGHTVNTQKHVFHTERKDGFKPSDMHKQSNHQKHPMKKGTKVQVCIVNQTMEPVIKIKKYRNIQTCFYSYRLVAGESRSFLYAYFFQMWSRTQLKENVPFRSGKKFSQCLITEKGIQ